MNLELHMKEIQINQPLTNRSRQSFGCRPAAGAERFRSRTQALLAGLQCFLRRRLSFLIFLPFKILLFSLLQSKRDRFRSRRCSI